MINTDGLVDRVAELEQSLKKTMPTPPVGTPLVWYRQAKAEEGAEIAAICTKVEGPGKIIVAAFPPNGMPQHFQGVLHKNDPIHKKRNNAVSIRNGSWDYPKHVKPPKDHHDVHGAEIERRLEAARHQLIEAEEANQRELDAQKELEKEKQAVRSGSKTKATAGAS